MSGCTESDKPLISILMAVYEPNLDWLRIQLKSLNAQTYPNLQLYIRDDCSSTGLFCEIQSCVKDCISAFPYEIVRSECNSGSNETFAQLTREAEGDCFAYCDQDDRWCPEKLAILQEAMTCKQALLVCSDMEIIDGAGNKTADSITAVRRHHVFHSGAGLAEGLLNHNFVTGCTMLVEGKAAKAALPYCPYMVHDHYIALWCAAHGKIVSLSDRLISYRIHGGNQTGIMSGVKDKASYGAVRIDLPLRKLEWLLAEFPAGNGLRKSMEEQLLWLQARKRYWAGQGGGRTVWKYRQFSPLPSLAELVCRSLPDQWFMALIQQVKNNRM